MVIIESVDSISGDEPDSLWTQYITNAGISRARYTIKPYILIIKTYKENSNFQLHNDLCPRYID